jgi:Thrombospondin type 3 repeat
MRRLSLLSAVVLLGLVAFAGTAQATPSGWSHVSSFKQAGFPNDADGDGVQNEDDQCPGQPGSYNAHGCPDADGDGVVDGVDRCPTTSGEGTTGCPGVKVYANGFLEENATIYIECSGEGCVPRGVAVLKLTKRSERKLHVHSSLIGRFGFTHGCGEGVRCAREHLGATLRKKAKAWSNAYEDTHDGPGVIAATITAEITYPRKETLSEKIKLEYGSNPGRFSLCDAYFAGSSCKNAQ